MVGAPTPAPLPYPAKTSKVLDVTTKGYLNMSVKPEAKRGLELLALDLSREFGRRVSLSEALELAMDAIYAEEIEIKDSRK